MSSTSTGASQADKAKGAAMSGTNTGASQADKAKGAAMADWQAVVAAMQSKAQAIDWSKVDWSKLSPSEIGVRFGAPMTEAEFREYRKNKAVHVVKANAGGTAPPVAAPSKKA